MEGVGGGDAELKSHLVLGEKRPKCLPPLVGPAPAPLTCGHSTRDATPSSSCALQDCYTLKTCLVPVEVGMRGLQLGGDRLGRAPRTSRVLQGPKHFMGRMGEFSSVRVSD